MALEVASVIPRPHEITIARRCSAPGVTIVALGEAAASAAAELEAVLPGGEGRGGRALRIVVGLVGGDGQRYLGSDTHFPPTIAQKLPGLPNSDQAYWCHMFLSFLSPPPIFVAFCRICLKYFSFLSALPPMLRTTSSISAHLMLRGCSTARSRWRSCAVRRWQPQRPLGTTPSTFHYQKCSTGRTPKSVESGTVMHK